MNISGNSTMWICAFMLALMFLVHGAASSSDSELRLHPYDKVLDASESRHDATELTAAGFQSFVDTLLSHFECDHSDEDSHEDSHEEECSQLMCINATDLMTYALNGNAGANITEEQFGQASVVLLDLITSAHDLDICHQAINFTTITYASAESHLLNVTFGLHNNAENISTDSLKSVLEILEEHIVHENHDHHSDDHDDHSEDDSHDDSHDDDDDHDDHDEHSDEANALVVGSACLGYDSVLYFLNKDGETSIPSSMLHEIASIIIYQLYIGSDVSDSCRQVPFPGDFLGGIFTSYGDQSGNLDVEALESIMTMMGITTSGHDDHDDHEGHDDHRRRRRSVQQQQQQLGGGFSTGLLGGGFSTGPLGSGFSTGLRRTRRQAAVSSGLQSCYSAAQLLAVYDASSGVDKTGFEQLCPSLVSQTLFADCSSPAESKSDVTDAEKYGYGTIAIALICLTALGGIVLLPCTSIEFCHAFMSLFIGLAAGALSADALMHLIPMALGVHAHGDHDDHGHGSEYKVEEHVQYALVILGGIYVFFLLEALMTVYGGHSHGHDSDSPFASQMSILDNGMKSVSEVDISMGPMGKSANGIVSTPVDGKTGLNVATSDPELQSTISEPKKSGIPPIAMMILLGDAVHNFADGLAVGAAFSASVTTGISTSIAVFCHELPHELGDFAVLLKSGFSIKKAMALNLLSALTAFIGLYVGILISTTEKTQSWIFALAAGMFLYIALVDLLPQMTRSKNRFHLLLANIGIIIGIGILLIIAVFEEHIKI